MFNRSGFNYTFFNRPFRQVRTGDLAIPSQSVISLLGKKEAQSSVYITVLSSTGIWGIGREPGMMPLIITYNEDFLGKKIVTSPHIGDYRWALHHEVDLALELDLDKQFYLGSSYQHLFGYMFGLEPQTISHILETVSQTIRSITMSLESSTFLETQGQKKGRGSFESPIGSQIKFKATTIRRSPAWQITVTHSTEFEGVKIKLFFTWIYLQGRLYREVELQGRLYAEKELQGRLGVV